ncbi:hypothetical protein D9M68_94990 [compost metagenome]
MVAADALFQFQHQYFVIIVGSLELYRLIPDGLVLLFRNSTTSIQVVIFFVSAVNLYQLFVVFGIYFYHLYTI